MRYFHRHSDTEQNRFWQIVSGCLFDSKKSVALAVLSMLAMTLTNLLKPWPLKIIFDYILLGRPVPATFSFANDLITNRQNVAILVFSSTIVGIAAFRGLFAYMETYHTAWLGNEIAFRLRTKLFSHLQRLSISFHTNSRTGELMSKLSGDTATVKSFFSDSALVLGSHLLTIILTFLVMFMMNWSLALVVLASFPILVINGCILHQRAGQSARKQRKKADRISSRIHSALSSVQLIQAFGRERYEEERFERENGEYREESLRNVRIESAAARAVEITTAIGTFAVVLYGSMQVLKGFMSPGSILVFTSYLHGLYRPIRRMVKLTVRFSRLRVSIQRISEIFAEKHEIKDRLYAVPAVDLKGEIVFENVSFAYSNDEGNVLKDLSFHLSPGQRVVVVGASGAGKSTLIGLVLRLYDPQGGRILIDGVDIRDYKVDTLRNQIGIVMQDSVLFGATVFENIAYGSLDAKEADVIAAAKAASAHDFISQLPDEYDTVIGERGARLSGGQQRRIAIARALIRNAPILILDEPMNGLDMHSEQNVSDALYRLMDGKTCLTITHDFASAVAGDLVIVLDEGKLVECGRPSDLANAGGMYQHLRQHSASRR